MNLLSGAVVHIRETESVLWRFFKEKIYENFIGIALETVRNREVSVLERSPYREVRQYLGYSVKSLLLYTPLRYFRSSFSF